MSGTALFSVGVRALAANYAALQTTGHNIANANVEGYSRQRVELATSPGQFTGGGFIGRGVDVATVTRSHNAFLTREASIGRSLAAADAARLHHLSQLEQVFKTGEQGLGHSTTEFLSAMSDLASRPYDGATRQVVLARADALAQRFADAGGQIENVQRGVTDALRASIAAVNALAGSIAEVNQRIASARGLGQPANDLLDRRDQLIAELSSHVQLTTLEAEDGTLGVFMGGGQRLVLGIDAERLEPIADRFDASRLTIGISDGAQVRRVSPQSLGAGSIAGLLRFQEQDLVAARTMMGQMAAAISGAVNAQHQLGVNLGPNASAPMFEVGEPLALPASSNLRDVGGNFVGSVTLTIDDAGASQLKASEYRLVADPLGSGDWQLTRLSDGHTQLVASGDVVDGMRIDIAGADPGDQFLLQPVSRAAAGMRALLSDPRDVAAAAPLVASTVPANTGTAAISMLTMTAPPVDAAATAQITFGGLDPADPTGRSRLYTWDLVAGGVSIGTGSGSWTVGRPLPSPPDPDINGFALTLTGVPAGGDVLEIVPTAHAGPNNGNAAALAALRDQMLVGRDALAGGGFSGGVSFNEAYVAAIADIGVRAQSAQQSATISSALALQAETARASETGVNLDEEAARLIQFQQAYQAAAKVLQIAQSVFDTLLQTAA